MKVKPVLAAMAAFLMFLWLAPAAYSAAPAVLSYQATLRKGGVLFTGAAAMEFSITSADGSVTYWTSGSTDVVVTSGLFRYPLGAQNAAAFAAIPWGDITPYVQTKVDGGLLPREPLYSSAYSLYASRAEGSAGNFTAYDGDIRISTTSGSKGIVFQNGTAQYSAPGWTLSGANAYTTFSGNAGIGVAGPQARLDVQAGAASQYSQIWRDASGVIKASMSVSGLLYADGSMMRNMPTGADGLGNHTATRDLDLAGYGVLNADSISGNSQALKVGSELWLLNSRFGIGTNAPAAQLHISTSAGSSADMLVLSTGAAKVIRMTGAGAVYATKYYGDGSSLSGISGGGGADNLGSHALTQNLVTGAYWISSDGANTGLNLDAAGNVGVGQAAGSAKLDVRGAAGNYIQIWRNASGIAQASMTVLGTLYADGSQLRNLPQDNLGDHTATQNLNMAARDITAVSTITVGYLFSQGAGVVFTTNALVMGGRLGIDTQLPQEKLHVQGNILSSGLSGSGNRCVYADNTGVLRLSADACGLAGVSGDNLGNHVLLQNLNTNGKWLSGDNSSAGLTVSAAGNVGVGLAGAATRLDVMSGADGYAQFWRNAGGVVVASMTSAGLLYADAAGLRNLPSGADNLGSHTATQALNLAGWQILNVASITVTGPLGAGFSKARLSAGVEISSASPAQLGGVYVSTNIYVVGVASATKYYGDGSQLTGLTGVADNLGNHTATQDLNMAARDITAVSTITAGYLSSQGAGVVFTTNALVMGGRLGIDTQAPQEKLHVQGNILSSSLSGSGNRCVYADNTGVLRLSADACGLAGVSGDNLGNHVLLQNLNTNGKWLSGDNSSAGLTVSAAGNVGVGLAGAATRLDVMSGGDGYAQFWRNAGGVVVASMTSAGLLYADASGMRNLPSGADNLGSHTATQDLDLASHKIVNVSTMTAGYITSSGPAVVFSTHVIVSEGNLGVATYAPQERLHVNGNILSATLSGASNRCVYVDMNGVLRAKGTDCGSVAPTGDNLGDHKLLQNLNTNGSWLSGDGNNRGLLVDINGNVTVTDILYAPAARLDVRGAVGNYIQAWRSVAGVVQASMSATGVLYADGSGLRNLPSGADNLGSHIMTQNLVTNSRWISSDGDSEGVYVDATGNVGIGQTPPATRLDVKPAAGDSYAQIWRNSGGVVVASMTAAGLLYADAAKLRNLPSGADSLGSHIATATLQMSGYGINNAGGITANGQITTYSSVTVSGALGLAAAKVRLSANVELSSASAAQLGGVYVSSNIYVVGVASAARYYGDGSQLTGLTGADNLGSHTATQDLNMASKDITAVSTITAGYLFSQGAGVVFTTNALVMGGRLGIDTQAPQEKLHVQGNILSSSLSGSGNRCVYADSLGVLRVSADACGLAGTTGDNLGNYVMLQNLSTNGNWISGDGSSTGLTVGGTGNVGVGVAFAETRLDVMTGAGSYAQFWRDSGGVIVASMTSGGLLYADAAGLRNLPAGSDSLGSHIATATLQMAGFGINDAGSLTANGPITTYSSITVAGAQGLETARVRLNTNVELTPAAAAQLGGVHVSTNIYVVGVASATRYYGDGSQLTGLTGVADNLGNHTATQNLNMAAKDITAVSTITVGYLSSQGVGVVFSTNALVMGGRLGVDTQAPQEKLHVQGNILSSGLSGSGNRCVYADNSGVLRPSADACGLAGVSGDNLGNHVMAQNLAVGSHWISYDGSAGGLSVNISSNVGIGVLSAATRLDVKAAAGDGYMQIWRNSSGLIVASMTANGKLFADGSGLSGIALAGGGGGGGGCVNPNDASDIMVVVGDFCVDKYEASVWSGPAGGTQYGADAYPCGGNGQTCASGITKIFARSVPDVVPASSVTWFQANIACANSGKHLLTNVEWQAAATGTADPGASGVAPACNVSGASPSTTGAGTGCLSAFGTESMVGSVAEWVAEIGATANDLFLNAPGYGDDVVSSYGGGAYSGMVRGGSYAMGSMAGVFSILTNYNPTDADAQIGFRCGMRLR